jgi:signal transduction histidine kinase
VAGLVVIVALLVLASGAGLLQVVEDGLSGIRFRLLQRPVSQTLTVVEIDTASIRAAGRWPWTRDRYATAIRNLQAAGAKVVGFDVDFSAPSSPDGDARLQATIQANPGSVVLPTFVQPRSRSAGGGWLENAPLDGLAAEAVLASVNVPVDPDGRVRRYGYGFEAPVEVRPSMGALLAEAPPGRLGSFILDYGIRIEDTPHLSFQDVYEGRFDPAAVRGRSVLIGATALELGDEFATPRFGTLSGVYVHALAYESVRSGRDLTRLHPYVPLVVAFAVVFLLRPRSRAVSLRRLLLAHLAVGVCALALPLLIQAFAPVAIEVAPILLGQVLVLIWTVRSELQRRAQAMVEAREAHLLQLADHMRKSRNKIRAANRRLQTANAALDKALKARTEFLASTSHEIRTPLNGILGMTQVILADTALDPRVRQNVGVVQTAGRTMLALVDDILDMSKIENGHLTIVPVEMDLHGLLDEAGLLWSAKAAEKNLALRIDRGDAPAWILEDDTRLRQIISNLMANAIKFTEAGEVALSACVEGRGDDEILVLKVSDSGIGIPADKLEEIFEAFRQVDGSITRQYGGTGLGLAISRRLALAMGGELTVSSTLGEGSVFRIVLPLRRVSREAAPASVAGQRGPSILLVEANPLAQSVLKAAFAPHAERIEIAASLDAAMATLQSRDFDVVLAEGGALGGAPGLDRLAACPGAARICVLWAGAAEDVDQLLRGGADHVARKPISTGDLVAELKSLWAEPRAPRDSSMTPTSAVSGA